GNICGLAVSLTNLAILTSSKENLDQAISYMEEALSLDRQVGNRDGIADSLGNLASLVAQTGDLARAAQLDSEALEIRRELGDSISIAYSLESIGGTTARAGDWANALRLLAAANHLRDEIAAPLPAAEMEAYESAVGLSRDGLTRDAFDLAWAEGQGLTLEDAMDLAQRLATQIAGRTA
ncbi:MAG: tetratricopeptide repeat protein, partial [Chloroflexia bacterium]|nr:tetratricopeptide repeat protein [Chloroflexia bacterium]